MGKLEWCRANAPDALKYLSDTELLEIMSAAYDRWQKDNNNSDSLSTHSEQLDYMFCVIATEFGSDVAFKGGYLLSKLVDPAHARVTHDIDFSVMSEEIYSSIVKTLSRIGDTFKSKGIASSYEIKPHINKRMAGGVKYKDKDGRVMLGVDVGWHDISYGVTQYTIDNIICEGFEVERMVADKLSAILSTRRYRRSKDFYDVYIILLECDLNLSLIHKYIVKRFGSDIFEEWPFTEEAIEKCQQAYNAIVINTVTNNAIEKPAFKLVYSKLAYLMDAIQSSVQHEVLFWDACKQMISI